jgi:hypothetical protein
MSHKRHHAYYQEPLFNELRRDTCYVCHERIAGDDGLYIGKDLWRHKKCKPGGRSWLKSRVGHTPSSEELFGSDTSK